MCDSLFSIDQVPESAIGLGVSASDETVRRIIEFAGPSRPPTPPESILRIAIETVSVFTKRRIDFVTVVVVSSFL